MGEVLKKVDLKEQLSDNLVDDKELKQLDQFLKEGKFREKYVGPVDFLGYGKEGNIKAKAFAQALDKILDSETMTKDDLDNLRSFYQYQPMYEFLRQSSFAIISPYETTRKSTIPGSDNWRSLVASIDSKINMKTQSINTKRLESFSLSTGSLDSFVSAFSILKQSYGDNPNAQVTQFLDTMSAKERSLYEEKLSSFPLSPLTLNDFVTIRNQYKAKYLKKASSDLQAQDFLDKMILKETLFKRDRIKETWNKEISFDGYTNLVGLMEPFKQTIDQIQNQYLDKIQAGEYEGRTIDKYYSFIDRTDIPKNKNTSYRPKEAQQEIDDIFANENRISLGMNLMSVINSNPSEFSDKKQIAMIQTKFESVIRNTPNGVVNSFMKELCTLTDDQVDRVFNNLCKKLLRDKKTDRDYRITSLFSVESTVRDLSQTPKAPHTEGQTSGFNFSFFDNIKDPEVVDISDKDITTKVLNTLSKFNIQNPNIQETIISCPKSATTNWYGTILLVCQAKYPTLKNIKIQEVDGTTDLSIKTIEKKVTKEQLTLDFPNLEANVIADKEALQARLSQNPDMKALIENPNYKIMSGKFFGSASKSPNSVSEKATVIDKYKDNKNISFVDKTEPALSSEDRNKDLAINRAASAFELFNSMSGKIIGPVQIEYAVGGPTREEILKNNPNATEEDIMNEYKKYQNSSLDLTLEKTDYPVQETAFSTVKTQVKDLALKMNYEQTPRASFRNGTGQVLKTVGGGVGSIFSDTDGGRYVRSKGGCSCKNK